MCSKACSKCRLYDANKSLFSFAIRNLLIKNQGVGVDDGTRTHDNRNHNPGLYQLSYVHQISIFGAFRLAPSDGAPGRTRTCNPRLSVPPLLSQPPPFRGVRGLDYLFTVSGAARIVSTDPRCRAAHSKRMCLARVAGFHGIAIGATR